MRYRILLQAGADPTSNAGNKIAKWNDISELLSKKSPEVQEDALDILLPELKKLKPKVHKMAMGEPFLLEWELIFNEETE